MALSNAHYNNSQISVSVNNNNMSAIDAAGPAYSYDALFPALPESFPSFMSNSASTNIIRVESSVVTQVKAHTTLCTRDHNLTERKFHLSRFSVFHTKNVKLIRKSSAKANQ